MPFITEPKENTSISIRPSIAERGKRAAARRDLNFSAWVEGAIRMRLLVENDTPEFWDEVTEKNGDGSN